MKFRYRYDENNPDEIQIYCVRNDEEAFLQSQTLVIVHNDSHIPITRTRNIDSYIAFSFDSSSFRPTEAKVRIDRINPSHIGSGSF